MSAAPLRVGIIQSSYLPWRGYFDFIDDVDLFLFLEDVEYSRGTWRNRNRLKTPQGLRWLTVPVHHRMGMLIQEVEIDYGRGWIDKHIDSLRQSYGKAPFFRRYAQLVSDTLAKRPRTISELNIALTLSIMTELGVRTKTRLSNEFPSGGAKDARVLSLLRAVGATHYLSGPAAKDYIVPARFAEARIVLEYKRYQYAPYPQLHGAFEGQVTALDLLFNCGPDARAHLKSKATNEIMLAVAASDQAKPAMHQGRR